MSMCDVLDVQVGQGTAAGGRALVLPSCYYHSAPDMPSRKERVARWLCAARNAMHCFLAALSQGCLCGTVHPPFIHALACRLYELPWSVSVPSLGLIVVHGGLIPEVSPDVL